MADLGEEGPADLLDLPVRMGEVTLSILPRLPMISIAPFRGRGAAVDEALADHLEAGLPETGGSRALGVDGRIFWTGADQWFLRAPEIADDLRQALSAHAAVSDQSDAWTGFGLEGAGVAEALARLVPVDIGALGDGAAVRTMLGHMMCAIVVKVDGVELWVMRSFSLTAVHDLTRAMTAVAAIAELRARS